MFTFIILFLLYGGLSRSVCRRKIEGENSYFDEMNQSLSKKKTVFMTENETHLVAIFPYTENAALILFEIFEGLP